MESSWEGYWTEVDVEEWMWVEVEEWMWGCFGKKVESVYWCWELSGERDSANVLGEETNGMEVGKK